MGHRKSPLFIKIITTDSQIVCVNPSQLSSFQVLREHQCARLKEGIVGKPKGPEDLDHYTADVLRFYYPQGTQLSYEVGKDITKDDLNYILAALNEWVYLTSFEFQAMQEARAKDALEAWQPETQSAEPTTPEA